MSALALILLNSLKAHATSIIVPLAEHEIEAIGQELKAHLASITTPANPSTVADIPTT